MQTPLGTTSSVRIRDRRPGARSAKSSVRLSMKRLDAAKDNEMRRQITRTRQVWQPRMDCNLTDEDARQILHFVTGFFGVLAECRRAEMLTAANDCAAPVEPNNGEVRHDR